MMQSEGTLHLDESHVLLAVRKNVDVSKAQYEWRVTCVIYYILYFSSEMSVIIRIVELDYDELTNTDRK